MTFCLCLGLFLLSVSLFAQNKMDSLLRSIAEEMPALSLFNQYDQVFRQSLYSDHILAAAAVDSMQLLISQNQ